MYCSQVNCGNVENAASKSIFEYLNAKSENISFIQNWVGNIIKRLQTALTQHIDIGIALDATFVAEVVKVVAHKQGIYIYIYERESWWSAAGHRSNPLDL